MKTIDEYAGNLRGVAEYAKDSWDRLDNIGVEKQMPDEMFRTGKMMAYSRIIQLITGRNIETEREIVIQIIKSIR